MRDLVAHYIGGGWGAEAPDPASTAVRVIRGADFPAVASGSLRGVPSRYEAHKKVPNRTLQPGDIVLEVSGGTKDRPTGRTVFIDQALLDQAEMPVIPASFCRLLRPNAAEIVPAYLFYWLQDMYAKGRTWGYQIQSTGLANFQTETFLDAEVVRVPALPSQRRIAHVLSAFDALVNQDLRLVERIWDLAEVAYTRCVAGASTTTLGDVLTLGYGKGLPARVRCPGPYPVVSSAGIVGSHSEALVRGPGVVVGRKGTVGSVTWVGSAFFPIDTAFYVQSELPMLYCYFALREAGLSAMNTDSAVPGLNRENALRRIARRPSAPALEEFEQVTTPLTHAIQGLEQEIEDLRKTRDELLPLLISGRVRVEDVEGLVA